MDEAQLSMIAGTVLSLLFSYVPGLKGWYEKLSADFKRLVMLVVLLVTSGAIYGLSCAGWLDMVACDKEGLIGLVNIFFAALVANQATYLISPERK